MGSNALETCPACGNKTNVCQGWRGCMCGWSEKGEDEAAIAALVQQGHPEHCAQRQVWGDGECECADVAAGHDPDAWKKAKPAPAPLPEATCKDSLQVQMLPEPLDSLVGRIFNAPHIPGGVPVPEWYVRLHNDATALAEEVARQFPAITRRLAEVEGERDEAQAGAHAEQEVSRAWMERAEAAEARVGELEWLVEVQRVYALGIIDMGSESEYRTCALDELSLSYADALKCAGIWEDTKPNDGVFTFNWSSMCEKAALAAVEG